MGFILLSQTIFGSSGLKNLHFLRETRKSVQEKISFLKKREEELNERIRKIRTDPFFLKEWIRKELNYIQEDEKIVIFPP
jgi:cell division protein FtsB